MKQMPFCALLLLHEAHGCHHTVPGVISSGRGPETEALLCGGPGPNLSAPTASAQRCTSETETLCVYVCVCM